MLDARFDPIDCSLFIFNCYGLKIYKSFNELENYDNIKVLLK